MSEQTPLERSELLPVEFPVPGSGALEDWWPLFSLRLEAGPLTLRPVTDGDLPALLQCARAGIHPRGLNPFGAVPWSEAPASDLAKNMLQHIWEARAEARPDQWRIHFGVWEHQPDSAPALIGMMDLGARHFAQTRTVSTGSWLRYDAQGRGLGTLARSIVLVLAFDHFGALAATTDCASWNQSSAAVSLALGYQHNGVEVEAWGRTAEVVLRFRLDAREFTRPETEVIATGVEASRQLLGIRDET
ncbi:GNAT family N-acetyltransferase [Citricoccus sp. GCM10030269]|uniref:GNAT family N-acetyltransferase n=1 Tax=Citricoccus sp. GCM10030269 TaxID=3273388 RepID=UPI00360B4BCC